MQEISVLVTGSSGFLGQNLCVELSRHDGVRVLRFDVEDDSRVLEERVRAADTIYHLAGVNRPRRIEEFSEANSGLTRTMVEILERYRRKPAIVLSSSTQAGLDNPYGKSKREAEEILLAYGRRTGARVYLYRLANVFGKWSRPNYNSVVATFCHNISHGLEIAIADPARVVELVYIDDVVAEFAGVLHGKTAASADRLAVSPSYKISLGELADRIHRFHEIRSSLVIPDLSDEFTKKLHATYLSYLDQGDFSYGLDTKADERGELAELLKSAQYGQMFVSRSHGGVIRGNHYHDTKTEKFCVLQGDAMVRLRQILSDEVVEYRVSGGKWQVLDIPPGYTHHIENLSDTDLIVLFWASTIFDPLAPDTHSCEVQR